MIRRIGRFALQAPFDPVRNRFKDHVVGHDRLDHGWFRHADADVGPNELAAVREKAPRHLPRDPLRAALYLLHRLVPGDLNTLKPHRGLQMQLPDLGVDVVADQVQEGKGAVFEREGRLFTW